MINLLLKINFIFRYLIPNSKLYATIHSRLYYEIDHIQFV